ncbi:DUF6049 family protein [Rathayibacter sp. VKM Ac-2760]|uniref:DUF6049 family protein n=1 Tax=Rathayibacter sp. VKM Ac-2760 TaxID=2609253 RepID=UPI001FC9AFF2|nr:DUF6049 family protein [Rathayibacter sp. VKM Ac-2760]
MRRRDLTPTDRPRPRRAVPQLLRSLGAAALSIALLGSAPPAHAATAEQPAAVSDTSQATVTATVGAANDGVLLPGQDLQLAVSVRNGTTESIDGARVEIAIDDATLDSRAELAAWLDGEAEDDGTPTGDGADVRLLPSSSAQVSITVPDTSLPFSTDFGRDPEDFGSHALSVTITSPGGTVATARGVVELSTGIPAEQETGVSVLVPLTVPDTSDGLLSAETLQDYTQTTGTLSRQLDSVDGRAVTIGLDPRILASIRVLGTSAPESATAWLDRLESVPNEVFALPYADADVAAQAQSGLATLLAPTSFEYALDPALFAPTSTATPTPTAAPDDSPDLPERPTTESLLAFDWSPTVGGLAWPDGLTVRSADLGVYATTGMNRTVVSSANLELPEDVSTTTRATIDGHDVVVADSALSTAFDAAVSASTDSEWRASTADLTADLAQLQREGESPSVVLALDRGAAIDGVRLSQTLDAVDALPWAEGSSLAAALTSPATEDATVVDSPESEQRLEAVSDLLTAAARVEAFSAVLTQPELLGGKRRNDLLALLSVTWREDATGWQEAVAASRDQADTTLSSVAIESSDSVTQLSRDSSIPVYVRNDLPWPVTVRIQASTSNAVLDIDESSVEPTAIDARSQGRVLIPVKARVGNGETELRMQLTAEDGTPIGAPTSIVTNVRADWETVGTLGVGILLVLVFGIGILRNIRRRRRGDTPDEPDEDPNAVLAVQPGLDDDRTDPRG